QTLIGGERFILFPERLQVAGNGQPRGAGELMLRKLIKKSLERRVGLGEFLFISLCIRQEQIRRSPSGRRRVLYYHFLEIGRRPRACQHGRGVIRLPIGINFVTAETGGG